LEKSSLDAIRRSRSPADFSVSQDHLIDIGHHKYVVPAGSSFYMGDICRGLKTIEEKLVPETGFRLAIVDPPWPSKSRGKKVVRRFLSRRETER
jgi:hypothetical protein